MLSIVKAFYVCKKNWEVVESQSFFYHNNGLFYYSSKEDNNPLFSYSYFLLFSSPDIFSCYNRYINTSSFPDRIEKIIPGNHDKIHRTISHWFPIYLIPISLIYYFLTTSGIFLLSHNQWFALIGNGINAMVIRTIGANFIFWFLVGCLAHIVEDSICGRIPIINPTKPKVYFRLFFTNSPFEYIFSFCISVLVLIAKVPTFAIFIKSSLLKIM